MPNPLIVGYTRVKSVGKLSVAKLDKTEYNRPITRSYQMAQQYKFKNPSDATELDPNQGQVVTTDNTAVVDYHFNSWIGSFDEWVDTSVELSIDCQDFHVADLDDLISFLQTARAKLAEQNNGQK